MGGEQGASNSAILTEQLDASHHFGFKEDDWVWVLDGSQQQACMPKPDADLTQACPDSGVGSHTLL